MLCKVIHCGGHVSANTKPHMHMHIYSLFWEEAQDYQCKHWFTQSYYSYYLLNILQHTIPRTAGKHLGEFSEYHGSSLQ